MTEATSVFDNHWNVTKISGMPHRGFNADFHGNANDGKGINATIAQRQVKQRAFERRHTDLVEDGFARQWIHLRHQRDPRRAPQEPRLNLIYRFHTLPSHRHAELRYAHEFLG